MPRPTGGSTKDYQEYLRVTASMPGATPQSYEEWSGTVATVPLVDGTVATVQPAGVAPPPEFADYDEYLKVTASMPGATPLSFDEWRASTKPTPPPPPEHLEPPPPPPTEKPKAGELTEIAIRAQEDEKEAGGTVHTLEWHLKKMHPKVTEEPEEQAKRIEAYSDVDPTGVLKGLTRHMEAEKYPGFHEKTVAVTNWDGKTVWISPSEAAQYNSVKGKWQFDLAKQYGIIPSDSVYAPIGTAGEWGYYTKEQAEQLAVAGELSQYASLQAAIAAGDVALIRQATKYGWITPDREIANVSEKEWKKLTRDEQIGLTVLGLQTGTADLRKFERWVETEAPEVLKKAYQEGGAEGYNAALATLVATKATQEGVFFMSPADYDAYMAASPQGRFDIQLAAGMIPAGSEFAGEDKEGNFTYYPPALPELDSKQYSTLKTEFLKLGAEERAIIEAALTNYLPETLVKPKTVPTLRQVKSFQSLPVSEQFQKLIGMGIISPGSTLISEGLGGWAYYEEPDGTSAKILPWSAYATFDSERDKILMAFFSSLTGEATWLGITVPKTVEAQMPFYKGVLAPIPIIGTAALWDDMSPGWRAISVAGDILTLFSPLIIPKLTAAFKGATAGLRGLDYIEDAKNITRTIAGYSDEALKRLPPELVTSFKPVSEAMEAYGEQLVKIKGYERAVATITNQVDEATALLKSGKIAKGTIQFKMLEDAVSEGLRELNWYATLAADGQMVAQELRGSLSRAAALYGDDVIKTLNLNNPDALKSMLGVTDTSEALTTRGAIIKELTHNLPRDIADEVKRFVNTALKSTRTVGEIESELVAARLRLTTAMQKEMSRVKGAPDPFTWSDLLARVSELETELVVAKLGDITKLSGSLADVRGAIAQLERQLRATPKGSPQYDALLETLEAAKKARANLETSLAEVVKWPKMEWQEGGIYGGRGITLPSSTRPSRIGEPTIRLFGGGVRTRPGVPISLGGVRLVTGTVPSTTGPMRVTKVIPDGLPVPHVIEPEEPGVVPVSPQPIWIGEVEAPVREPKVKPTVAPFKEPEPGEITWTPSIVYIPKLDPEHRTLFEMWVEPYLQVYRDTKHVSAINALAANLIASGLSQSAFDAIMNSTFPIISPLERQAIEPAIEATVAPEVEAAIEPITEIVSAIPVITPTPVEPIEPFDTIKQPPPPPPPPFPPSMGLIRGGRKHVPPGSITWAHGWDWKYIPPPYSQLKPISLGRIAPVGAKNTGSNKPEETIQIIGQARDVPRLVQIDLGFVDIEIVGGTKILFAGGGLETDVGSRISSPTTGMDLGDGALIPGVPVTHRAARAKKKPPRKGTSKRDTWTDGGYGYTSLGGMRI